MSEAESGDQRGSRWGAGSRVICSGGPPASSRTQMCGTSLPPESATDLPSGEIAGDSSMPTKSVSRWKETGAPALGAAALREVRYAAPATATSSSAATGQTRFHVVDATAEGAIAEVEDAAEIPSRAKAT